MLKLRTLPAVLSAVAVLGGSVVVTAPNANAALRCATGIQTKSVRFQPDFDRAFGSCTSFDRASQQARITADCIVDADRNTSWFHDYSLHYTSYCTTRARASILSSRN